MNFGLFKNIYFQNVFTNYIYLIYMYKEDLALNNLQWLICHKTKVNKKFQYKKYIQILKFWYKITPEKLAGC